MKYIVIPSREDFFNYNYRMDADALELYTKKNVESIKGVVFKNTGECVGYLPVFYFDSDDYICGFEGWGGDEEIVAKLDDNFDFGDKKIIELLPSMNTI